MSVITASLFVAYVIAAPPRGSSLSKGEIVAPGRGHHQFSQWLVDTREWPSGGALHIAIHLGSGMRIVLRPMALDRYVAQARLSEVAGPGVERSAGNDQGDGLPLSGWAEVHSVRRGKLERGGRYQELV